MDAMERLAALGDVRLDHGNHDSFEEGHCAMELVAYLAGEPHSDHPKCACPVLTAFVMAWNDGLPDEDRTRLLLPFLPRLIGTRDAAKEERRALMAADWFVRVHTPAWLRLAGLTAHAGALASLPEITAMSQVPFIRAPLEAAHRDAAAAWDAARAAARAAAWDAARDAARDRLTPTVRELQSSALQLLDRMIGA